MENGVPQNKPVENSRNSRPYKVRLPRFIVDNKIGLGDVVKRATSSFGIRPCAGCERRAVALNRKFVFSGRPMK